MIDPYTWQSSFVKLASHFCPSYSDMDLSFPSSQSGEQSIQITIKHQSNCWSSLKTFSVWKVEIHPKIWYRFLVHTPKNDEELTFFYNKRKQLKYFWKIKPQSIFDKRSKQIFQTVQWEKHEQCLLSHHCKSTFACKKKSNKKF